MKKDILTVRLDARVKRLLAETQKRLGVSCSQVVRDAIVRYANQSQKESTMTLAERWAPYIGMFKGGDPEMSKDLGKKYRKALQEKYGRRSR